MIKGWMGWTFSRWRLSMARVFTHTAPWIDYDKTVVGHQGVTFVGKPQPWVPYGKEEEE